jgi:hypothetical protein
MTRHDPRDVTQENQQDSTRQPGTKDMASWKPGSESGEAKNVQPKGDFGVPVGSGPSAERDYVTRNTKRSDPGNAQARSGEDGGDSARTTGAGGTASGDGSCSGGDLDTDIVGIGTGGSGVAAGGPDDDIGAAASDGSSDEFASGPHAQGRNAVPKGHVGGDKRVRGSVVSGDLDASTGADGQSADNLNNPAVGDDAFAGEVTLGEALGEDNPVGPSSDTTE